MNRWVKPWSAVIVAVTVSVAVTIAALAPMSAFADDRIESVSLMRDDAGKPGATVPQFTPQDRKQHFAIKLRKLEVGKNRFQAGFVGVETASGNNVEIFKTGELGNSLIANTITAQLSLPRDWPLGRYAVEVLMNDKPIGSREYIVSPEWSKQTVERWFLYADDGTGNPAERKLTAFSSKQRTLHFEAQTSGYVPRGTRVTWLLRTQAGQEVMRGDNTIAKDSAVFNRLTSFVTLPRDWPAGGYTMQLLDGSRVVGEHKFNVTP